MRPCCCRPPGPEGNGAASIAAAIRAADVPGLIDVVPGAQTVLVTFAPGSQDAAALADRLRQLAGDPAAIPSDAASGSGASEPASARCRDRHRV